MQLAILDDYVNAALKMADWQSLSPDIEISVFEKHLGHDTDAVAQALKPFDIIVGMRERTPFPKELIDQLPNLKLLITTGMRNLSFDYEACNARGIPICGTGMTSYAAAEHSWAMVMGLAKNIAAEDADMKSGGWQTGYSAPLNGATLGLIGLGKLGGQCATYGNAFKMNVVAWSQNLTDERAAECGATRVDRDTLLRDSDYVVIHQVLSDRTRGLIGKEELGLMKDSAFLVNTSRGPIVDEAALVAALNNGDIAGAAIDVFDVEPLPLDHPFRSAPRILLTGHTGYLVEEGIRAAYTDALDDVKAWLTGKPVRVINEVSE